TSLPLKGSDAARARRRQTSGGPGSLGAAPNLVSTWHKRSLRQRAARRRRRPRRFSPRDFIRETAFWLSRPQSKRRTPPDSKRIGFVCSPASNAAHPIELVPTSMPRTQSIALAPVICLLKKAIVISTRYGSIKRPITVGSVPSMEQSQKRKLERKLAYRWSRTV